MPLHHHVMPAEWQSHSRTLMALPGPGSHSYWPPGDYEQMCNDVVRVAQAIARFEPVTLYVTHSQAPRIRQRMEGAGKPVEIRIVNEDDLKPWMRDIAPTFVVAGDSLVQGIDFNFNGWGGKDESQSNRLLAQVVLKELKIPLCKTFLVAEGGAIETDGEGTLLATESSLINPNRNPGMDLVAVEEELKRILGVTKIIWLEGVDAEDTTDCHIDALARFVRPGVVVISRPHATRSKAWTVVYEEARRVLEDVEDARGRKLEIVDLPEPDIKGILDADPEMVPSYVNYYHVAGAVIVPQFGFPKTDQEAVEVMHKLFPEKEICPVALHGLPNAGGGLHCITQQIPVSK